jgi:uncharacterized membrane protein YfcA
MIVIAILTGMVTGVLSGLLGIGGGAILVASAVVFMGIGQHAAQAAALAAMIPTALVGVAKHHRNKLINYQVASYIAVGIILGGIVGAYVANSISETLLRKIFSGFFAVMSVQMFWSSYKQGQQAKAAVRPPDEK